jgi:cell division protein FtsA
MKEEIIAGLDIGSTAVRLVVGQKIDGVDREELQVIGAVSSRTTGVSKGIVNSIEDVTSSISECLEKAERLVGVPVDNVWVSVNDPYIKCEKSKGTVAVSKIDGEIDESDVERAIEASRALAVPTNYEILHVIPIKFSIDNQTDIKDPVGMSGVRLEVETLIVLGLNTQIKNLTKAIYRTGLDIEDLVLAPLAASEAALSVKQKELGVAVINIGSSTTSLAIYEEGDLLHTAVLPLGSEHITSDIAIGMRCPIGLADKIKIRHGHSSPSSFRKEEIDITDLMQEEGYEDDSNKYISKKYIAEIIEARVEEIFEKINNEFKKVNRYRMLPAGVVLVGGGSQLTGLVETAKEKLFLPASIGRCNSVRVVIDKVHNPEYLTALGLVIWGNRYSPSSENNLKGKMGDIFEKTKDFFKKMIPK